MNPVPLCAHSSLQVNGCGAVRAVGRKIGETIVLNIDVLT
jgi:hypothetical protein